ncbi:sodium/proline symporter [Cloacibacillus porcorum]|uniref:sodium/proline symporter n=1 Tax=Cloacibacillus porcorum TaxID=1197717 RepID=UPI002674046A|nr:sodium/proline symporter [Cloacibacillus porcorum]
MNTMLTVSAIYLVIFIMIGFIATRYFSSSAEGFYLGDRDFGAIPTALSAGATDSSGWIFTGAVGFAYAFGVSMMWICVGYTFGYFFNYICLAPALRRYTKRTGAMSIPHFFGVRFKEHAKLLRGVSSLIITLFFVIYTSAQLTSAGKAFEALVGWDYEHAIWVSAFLGTSYAFLGGYRAVVWTDVVQGSIMLLVLLVSPFIFIFYLGGWHAFWERAFALDPMLLNATAGIGGYAGFAFAFGLAAGGIGLICRVIMPTIHDPEFAFPVLIKDRLHPMVAGVVLAAVFSAILSTLDSLIMVVSQTVHLDIIEGVFNKKLSDRWATLVGRIVIVSVGICGACIALSNTRMVFWFVLYAWAVMGASFAPPLILGLYWKRVTALGALGGIITGGVVTVLWYNTPFLKEIMYEMLPAALSSTFVTVAVSFMQEAPADGEAQIALAKR